LSSPFHELYEPLATWLAGERISKEKIVGMVGTRTAIATFPRDLPGGRNGIQTDVAGNAMMAEKR
jgi:hypothetical protein